MPAKQTQSTSLEDDGDSEMRHVRTRIALPPGLLPHAVVREVLRLVFEEFRWFTPVRYGWADMDRLVLPGQIGFDALVAFYANYDAISTRSLYVGARTDQSFIAISPVNSAEYPYVGGITWFTSVKPATKREWQAAHAEQIRHLMMLVGSPLAVAALGEDFDAKTRRWVQLEVGSTQAITVRDYSEGLAGLFWRNFFGPPFVELFGERLKSLPETNRRELGDGIVLVEPYPLPTDAETEAGKERERELISLLGPECFYDHERHTLPTCRPDLASLRART